MNNHDSHKNQVKFQWKITSNESSEKKVSFWLSSSYILCTQYNVYILHKRFSFFAQYYAQLSITKHHNSKSNTANGANILHSFISNLFVYVWFLNFHGLKTKKNLWVSFLFFHSSHINACLLLILLFVLW